MKFIKRIIFFISLFLLYFVIKEFLEFYILLRSVHPVAGYVSLIMISGILIYFILIPVFSIIRMPVYKGPTRNEEQEAELIRHRIIRFKKNEYLNSIQFEFGEGIDDREQYHRIMEKLQPECDRIRKKYVSQLFYTSSISQNGFIDAILILSSSISLIKEIFILFNGRVSNRDLLTIGKKLYYSMAIGGSEGVEYATQEIFSKLATKGIKSIPFIEKILGSLADGYVNSILLTRIAYITENYCSLTYIRSERDLYSSPKFISNATKNIISDIFDRISATMRKMALDRTVDFALVAVNPIGYVLVKTIDLLTQDSDKADPKVISNLKEGAMIIGNPVSYGLRKLVASLRKK